MVIHKPIFTNPNNGLVVSACTIDLKKNNWIQDWAKVTCKNCLKTAARHSYGR